MLPSSYAAIRKSALKYFTDNFNEKYAKDYKPDKISVAFLPCRGANVYAKPTECFTNPECMTMKFKVIRHDLLY